MQNLAEVNLQNEGLRRESEIEKKICGSFFASLPINSTLVCVLRTFMRGWCVVPQRELFIRIVGAEKEFQSENFSERAKNLHAFCAHCHEHFRKKGTRTSITILEKSFDFFFSTLVEIKYILRPSPTPVCRKLSAKLRCLCVPTCSLSFSCVGTAMK